MSDAIAQHNDPVKQIICIRRDLRMRRGKEIAQGSHASMMFLVDIALNRPTAIPLNETMMEWLTGSFTKVVLQVPDEPALFVCYQLALNRNIPAYMVTDNGTTEFNGVKTNTAVAIGPARSSQLDPIFGMLKLY